MILVANIFNSKEVYKRIPKVSSKDNPLRKVRGMYVTGDYRPPYYIDSSLHIMEINTNKPTIVDFTQASASTEDHVLNILPIEVLTDRPNIIQYSKASKELESDHVVNILPIQASTDSLSILSYTSASVELASDHVVNILPISMESEGLDITWFSKKKYETQPEPLCLIYSISTSKASIE